MKNKLIQANRIAIFTISKKALFLLFLFACNFFSGAQTNTNAVEKLQSYIDNIHVFNRLYPQEKVYIHIDNTGYYLGETIWFKAYVMNAGTHLSTNTSKVLYVELVNPLGKVLVTRKMEVKGGGCAGDIYLQAFDLDYHAGFYEIRAYTRMTLNFGEETIFSRVFPVFNPPDNEGEYKEDMRKGRGLNRSNFKDLRLKTKKGKRINIDFYPEGGNLIRGCKSSIAFKATDRDGYPIEVSGRVVTRQDKETIVTFETQHEGMGCFDYTPDETATEVIVEYDNRTYKTKLPEVSSRGYSMSVNALYSRDFFVNLEKNTDTPSTQLGLSITCRGELIRFQTVEIDSTVFFRFPKSTFPTGVNQITLFDNEGRIHSERLFFIPPEENNMYRLKVNPDKDIYNSREKITLDFEGIPGTKFSLSVRDKENTPRINDPGNILTTLLLTSDLKGYIANPSSYFSTENPARLIALDLLMKVQGWRRYEWQIMTGVRDFTPSHPLEKGLIVDGYVVGKSREMKFEFSLENNLFIEGNAEIDLDGRFFCPIDTALYGNYHMLMLSPGLKKANQNIRLNRWFSPPPRAYSHFETTAIIREKKVIREMDTIPDENKIIERKEVELDSLGMGPMEFEIKDVVVSQRRGGKDLVYDVEMDREKMIDQGRVHSYIVHDYLVSKNDGYILRIGEEYHIDPYRGGQKHWNLFRFDIRSVVSDTEWEYLTEFNVDEYVNTSHFIDLQDLWKIVVKEWDTFTQYEINVEEGAIKDHLAIPGYFYRYDKNSTYYPYRKNPNYRVVTFQGYSRMKDFYTGRPEREGYIPTRNEYSRTLYWNPDMQLDKKGKTQVSFYNNHHCRKIEISAEGIINGTPIMNK